MDTLPEGWIDLEPVLIDRSGPVIVLDCVVSRVCLGPHDGSVQIGQPLGIALRSPSDPADQDALPVAGDTVLRWLDDGAALSVLVDASGPLLLLSHGDALLAFEVERPRRTGPTRHTPTTDEQEPPS